MVNYREACHTSVGKVELDWVRSKVAGLASRPTPAWEAGPQLGLGLNSDELSWGVHTTWVVDEA